MHCLTAPVAFLAEATRGLWRLLVARDAEQFNDVLVEVAPPRSLGPLQERMHVERFRDLGLAVASHVCHLEGVDEAEFIFAAIVVLLHSLPHMMTDAQISSAPISIAGRMAAAATASSLLKFHSEFGYDHEFSAAVLSAVLTRDERAQYTSEELMESLRSFEATVAFYGCILSVSENNVFIKARNNIAEASHLGLLNQKTAEACMIVSFYLAFHAHYDIYSTGKTLSTCTLAAALSLAAVSCARNSGHATHMPFPDPDKLLVEIAAPILERVASLGPSAQTLVGGVFSNTQTTAYFMTLPSCVGGAARTLWRELS